MPGTSPDRPLLGQQFRVAREVPELGVEVDPGLRTLPGGGRYLVVAGGAVVDGVHFLDRGPAVVVDPDGVVVVDRPAEFPREAVVVLGKQL